MRLGVCIVVVGMGGERAGEERNNGVFPLPLQMWQRQQKKLWR